MTVSATTTRVSYTGDGSSTAFTITFNFYLSTDVQVLLGNSVQSSGYTIAGGNGSTGTCTFSTAPANGATVTLILNVPLTQLTAFVDGTAFPSASVNQINDRSIQAALRLDDKISRAIRAPDGDVTPSMVLPAKASRLSKALMFDTNGDITVGVPTTTTMTQSSIGALLNPQTPAELAASVTPINYAKFPSPWKDISRFVTDNTGATDVRSQMVNAFAAEKNIVVPSGAYKIVGAGLTIRDQMRIECASDAAFNYDDSGGGTYLFTNGVADTRGGYFSTQNLYILLLNGTAKAIRLLNAIHPVMNNTYVEGFIPADWATSSVAINARTNRALRIETSVATDSFFGEFNGLYINHCHSGINFPGGITGKHDFHSVKMFGDSIYGDTTAVGWDIGAGAHSVVNSCYMDAYANGANGGAFRFTGPQAADWRVHDVVFDAEPGAATVGSITSGVTVPMLAVGFFNSAGNPSDNQILGSIFSSGCSVTNVAASLGNFIENDPNIAQTWTATLVPQTSGSITLTSGVGGDTCFCEARGKIVRVWGNLVVASVSSPLGRLQIQGLPFTIANSNANYTPLVIQADGLQATAATALQGYGVRNSAAIEVQRFAAGVASTATAADIKAGSTIIFELRYVAA